MPEATKPNTGQGGAIAVIRRQEGDGNDCCNSENHSVNPVHTSKPLRGSQENGDSSLYPDSTQEQKPPNEGSTACVTEQGINSGCKPEDRQAGSGLIAGDLSPLVQSNTPRSTNTVQLTSKELRQQSRQLQSQELIRRILQSTAEVQSLVLQPKAVSPERQTDQVRGTSDVGTPSSETAQNSPAENVQLATDKVSSPCVLSEANLALQGSSACRTESELAEQKFARPTSPQMTDSASVKDLPPLPQENVTQIGVPEEDSADQTLSLSKIKECESQDMSSNMHSHIHYEGVTNTGRGDSPSKQRLDSIGSALDEGKKDLVNAVDIHQSIDAPLELAKSGEAKCLRQLTDIHELGERLDKSPTQETLKEILHILKHQSQLPSADDAAQQAIDTEHSHASPPFSHVTQQPSVSQPFPVTATHVRNQKSLQEKHSLQILDVKSYYESELEKLHIQLDGLRGNLLSLEGVLPMKMLEAKNEKLEQRCQVLEEIADELKNKCEKLQLANQDLDVLYSQSQKTNQTLVIRYQYLEQVNRVLEEKQLKVQNTIQGLEDRIVEFAETSNGAEMRCKQLEEANLNSATRFHQVEDARGKLESRNKKLSDEIQHASASVMKLQEVLLVANKRCQDLEGKIALFQVEKDDWMSQMDASNKSSISTQQRFEEVRTQSLAKDEVIHKLEEEIKGIASSFNKVIKGKAKSEENSRRDKDLLQKLLLEYDALVKEHHQTQMREKTLVDNLHLSEGEVSDLRGTVSKLIHRNSGLEDSLRETLHELSHDNSQSPGSHVFSPSAQRPQSSPARPTNDDAPPALWPGDNKKDHGSSHPASEHSRNTDASRNHKVDTPVRFNPPRKSTSTPVKSPRRNLDKSYKSPSPSTKVSKSLSNLVVKRADLVTRFDVVFEDVNSGELVSRTHSGRTIRSYDPTETTRGISSRRDSHSATPDRLVGGDAESALNAIRNGKVLSSGDWETPTTRKSKNRNVKDKSTSMNEISYEEAEHDMRRIVVGLERKFSALMDERKRLESTLSRIPSHRPTKRAKEDKAYLESRLDEVTQSIGSVRMQLRRHHAL